MNRIFSLIIALTLLVWVAAPVNVFAQFGQQDEDTEPTSQVPDTLETTIEDTGTELTSTFTGTLAPDDPDSPVFKENKIFGEETVPEEGMEEEGAEPSGPTHLFRFDYNVGVLITEKSTGIDAVEITYDVKAQTEVAVKTRRYRTTVPVEIVADIVGELFGNELVTCKLGIEFGEELAASLMIKHIVTEETEEEAARSDLAVQLKFDREKFLERWIASCLSVDGLTLETEGEKEELLLIALGESQPTLNAALMEDFYPPEGGSLEIFTGPFLFEDEVYEYLIQGQGEIVVEPL